MDIESLNRYLRELSPSERSYREGATFFGDAQDQARYFDNGVMRLSDEIFRPQQFETSAGRKRHPLAVDDRFYLRQHSRFDAIPLHVHRYVEMSYVYRGSCHQHVNGRDVLLRENQVLLLDSDCPHAIDALGEDDIMISVCVKPALLRTCLDAARDVDDWLTEFLYATMDERADHNRHEHFHSQESRRLRRYFQELMCEYFDPSLNANQVIEGLFQLILAELMRVYEADYVRREQEETGSKVSVVSLVRYIQEYYLTCTLESMAAHFFVTPNYVSRLLKQSTGKTYMQLVQEQRLSHAAGLLRSGACSTEEAARAVGYENMSFFYRKFKAAYGVTPAAYRTAST